MPGHTTLDDVKAAKKMMAHYLGNDRSDRIAKRARKLPSLTWGDTSDITDRLACRQSKYTHLVHAVMRRNARFFHAFVATKAEMEEKEKKLKPYITNIDAEVHTSMS